MKFTAPKFCEYCEVPFEPKYKIQKFCCLECANVFMRLFFDKKETKCPTCNKYFSKKYKTHKYCSSSCANKKNKKNFPRPVTSPNINNPLFAEFMGIMAGDGHISKYHVGITLNRILERRYAEFVATLAKKLFKEAPVSILHSHKNNTAKIQISSKVVADFLRKIWPERQSTPQFILDNEDLHLHFVRGLFDTEGTISFKIFPGKKEKRLYRQLTFTSYSGAFRSIVHDTLKRMDFSPTYPARNIYISNKEDIERYFNLVGSHNPKMLHKNTVQTYNEYLDYKSVMGQYYL